MQPRTKPIEPIVFAEGNDDDRKGDEKKEEVPPPAKPKPTPVPSANIFGSAKPVDTAAREREIEERLSKVEMRSKEEPYVCKLHNIKNIEKIKFGIDL